MNQNPFISNFPQLLEKIKLDIQNHEDSLFINSDDGVFVDNLPALKRRGFPL